ncbi:MAG: serine hydrolase [Cyclobacteriaceae bacterium]|nr:serine hydrolase [Cyclobacteriaceae bacterium]
MRNIPLILGLWLCLIPAFSQRNKSGVDKRLASLDAELQKVLDTWQAPGFAVAVIEKSKIVYVKGFGYRDLEHKLPVTPNTLFAIGSCTKAFTSSVLGLLREEKKMDFNESPRRYYPELKFFNSEMNESIIMKDLMSHRTGLPRHDYSWYLFPTESTDSLVQRIAHQEPFAGVREKWYYNNFMFLMQGVITEKITGKSWAENIEDRIFKPLGMTRSNFTLADWKKSEDAAFGYQLEKQTTIKKMDYYNIAAMSPAGSINSSVNEMSNWVITWINGGKFKGKAVLPASYVTEAMSSQMVVAPGLPDKEISDVHLANYGYGWFLASYKGHYRVEHGGNIDGFSASTAFFPSDSVGIVVLVNQNGSTVPSVVRNIIADRMLNVARTDWNKDLKAKQDKALKDQKEAEKTKTSSKVKGTRPSHSKQEFSGRYAHPGYGSFDLVVERDSLFAKFKLTKLWLRHYHYDVFEAFEAKTKVDTTASQLLFNFATNDGGDISLVSLKIEPELEPIQFKRTPIKLDVDKATLEKYAGEYELGGMVAKFYLKAGETLFLTVPGQPEYELIATGKDKFSIKSLDGFKIEFTTLEGKVTEAIFIQPNGTFKGKRK